MFFLEGMVLRRALPINLGESETIVNVFPLERAVIPQVLHTEFFSVIVLTAQVTT